VNEDLQDITAHLNGGIPAVDVDGMERYWGEFAGLKEKLFVPLRKDYYSLNLGKDTVRDTIYNDSAFENYGKKMETAYEKWQKTADKLLFNLNKDANPKELITSIAEKIVVFFENVKLLDKYDVYEALLSYWQTTMADDAYLVIKDGYETGRELDIFYKETNKKDGSVTKKENGWDGKIIPKEMIISMFFAEEKLAVDDAQRFIDEIQSRLDEFVEQESEENDDTPNEATVMSAKAAISLKKEVFEKTKLVRALQQQLDEKAKVKYADLTIEQIKDLLINRKWHTQIYEGIYALYKTVSQNITEQIVEIAERYENLLPEINAEVKRLEKKVEQHLRTMGFKFEK
jgi:type I restriction enzyme M protein